MNNHIYLNVKECKRVGSNISLQPGLLPGRGGSAPPALGRGLRARLQGNAATNPFSFLYSFISIILYTHI